MRWTPLLLLAAACSSTPMKLGSPLPSPSPEATPQTPTWLAAGSYGVGKHDYTFVDTTRATPANGTYAGAPTRTLVVTVRYPTPPAAGVTVDAAAAPGPFPLVMHSHGLSDNRGGEGYLGEHLASHGYVVAAPDFPLSNGAAPGGPTPLDTGSQPGDVSFVLDQLLAESSASGTLLSGTIDAAHIGASGLSLGGLTTLLLGFHARYGDPRVTAILPIAAPSCMFTDKFFKRALPTLLLQGDADLLVPPPVNTERIYPLLQQPREQVLLKNGSHTAFAGLATLLDPTMNYDRVGCRAVAMAIGPTGPNFTALGSADEGIAQDPTVCPKPCLGAFVDPSLAATRQQQLTRVVELAFFEARLRGNADAVKFLAGPLATENVEVSATTQ